LASLTVMPGSSPPPTPAAPTLISPANDATLAQPITFDWNDVANAVSYEIQIDNSSTISAPFVTNRIVTSSQATITGLPPQRLWWRVRARNSAGVFGPFSSTRRFTAQAVSSPPASASLSSLTLSPTSVTGGNNSQGTVSLSSAAPSGGAVIALTSNNTNAIVPASVTVAAGASTANFTATTRTVGGATSATITGTYNSVSRSATLTVNPVSSNPLPAPSLVSPANDARFSPGQTIVFDSSDVSGAANYTIQIDDSDSFPSPWLLNQTVTSSTLSTSTLPTRTMWWRVRANSSSGTPGNWSSVRRVEVKD
jgi:hypothetical protein